MMNQNQGLKRELKSRHIFMIALGGVIGTGLFLGSGYTIHEAGPGGAIVAYLVGGFVMYLTMLCLGELAVAMPDAGSYQTYATKHISPAAGYVVGWMSWLNWSATIGIELIAVSILTMVSRCTVMDLVRSVCGTAFCYQCVIFKKFCRS
ncbi:Arginine permease RocE [Bacillus cereus]|nr:Arginine permease RocE [Bacillus cereus]